MYLLMEKQHNRGQDGAGLVSVKLDMKPGNPYFDRQRSIKPSAINDIFKKIYKVYGKIEERSPERLDDPLWCKKNLPFSGEILLGHLRYGTYGQNDLDRVHPVMRQNNWKTRNLVLAGNFNLTNVEELFNILVELDSIPVTFPTR